MTTSPVLAITPAALPLEALQLGRTDTRTHAVHLIECPHLVGRSWHPADESERAAYPLCSWSRDQVEGHGRSHPATLEDAMREQGTPAGSRGLIRQYLTFVTYDEIWLPYSKSYVALGLEGIAVASFGKTYVWVRGDRIDLPGYVAGRHAGRSDQPSYGETCPRCFLAMPLTGTCDNCN